MNFSKSDRPRTNDQNLRSEKGFTLVELSIVIVIIGLIAAGVVTGQALVSQGKLRKLTTDRNSINLAFNAFKLEYNSLPGDMRNADSYWPGCNSGATATQCNGTGNNRIEWNGKTGADCPNSQEPLRLWQHLNLAGLISGNYTGVCSGTGYSYLDSFRSNYTNLSIFLVEYNSVNNILYLTNGGAANYLGDWNGVIKPKDASSIDSKIDDGSANTGILTAKDGIDFAVGSCLVGSSYTFTQNNLACVLQFKIQ